MTDPLASAEETEAAASFDGSLPDEGSGTLEALRELIERGDPAAVRSSGPRMFHFVTGGVTPATVGATGSRPRWIRPPRS